jgi:hypothetical protein
MNNALSELVADIKSWLARQPDAKPASERWYALNNLRAFLADLEVGRGHESIARAVKALNHHIADQLDWNSGHCHSISAFAARADRIARELASKVGENS